MAKSMTGFGRADQNNGQFEIGVEVRSLNNRYLDISLRLPKSLNSFEFPLKEIIKKFVIRGKVSLAVTFKPVHSNGSDFSLNADTVNYYVRLLEQIKEHTGLKDTITLEHLLRFKELVEPEEVEMSDEDIEPLLIATVSEALVNLNAMREQEGINIGRDITSRLDTIRIVVSDIAKRSENSSRDELDKLYARLQDRLGNNEIDRDRLELELAIIADRVDITEECTRLDSHINVFRNVFETKPEVGKQLTFLLQEMHRETNTIGSKTSDITISHDMIRLKEEIEKLREQIQNLE
ncbi:MAG: YicC family protein [Calditrichales bacterium]|nr:MAG: YicC family protein [Calditrichales bacterium]